MNSIRNFCIIAHIDHGKSTLADRMLEITHTVEQRKMKAQILDKMDLERERGITIKLAPVNMRYEVKNKKSGKTEEYMLNLIDTPGHVDFSYEVSRSLAAVEGAILLVDATQGIQAQTLANLYLAMEQNLEIIPVVNKIDLPAADAKGTKESLVKLLGCKTEEIIEASGKTGQGVSEILDAVIKRVPAPGTFSNLIKPPTPSSPPLARGGNDEHVILPLAKGEVGRGSAPLRALIFDSIFDEYRGVIAYVRVVDGAIKKGEKIKMLATKAESETLEVGFFKPDYLPAAKLGTGQIGYIVTGLKTVEECKVGDTVTTLTPCPLSRGAGEGKEPRAARDDGVRALPGYKEVKPMVFAGIFCKEGNEYEELREAIGKLKLTDASLAYEPEHSQALGFGFRCGFLGLLHLEITQERLRREFNLALVVTTPSVAYRVTKSNDEEIIVRSALELPDPSQTKEILEPWVRLDVVTPQSYLGGIMSLAQEKRGLYKNTEYLDEQRVILHYEMPMSTILTDFYDKIKSATSGYASINYDFLDYRPAEVVRMDIMVAEEPVESLAVIVYKDEAFRRGREIVESLKENLPQQMFMVKIQAAIGGKIIAAERLSALRKDVTAKLYGGDVSRKRKLLEKQKKGKKKMMSMGKGKVDIPPEAFLAVLKK
ncbi:elongation factor 4 [Candidatus Falkowbacteria bacterium CG10_big_fil_rev_8_21_14_0_10_43_11]|uniref:Elongation factor 4 n=1 Tax=Candidatus Falkowbacteria bacterium CG10_big_fil_rev_8_21_14_0_10_43_11 TaxID=1974568 RepID=A0A2M6WM95_9BACT|nr:MAG: elongation factor 4 [Candidatus Falkowbacteria bacterium CG10_big_fil_rev_8_21_14_0_10_43_11]